MTLLTKPDQAVFQRVMAQLAQGNLPALYPAQNDTFQYADNVDPTHPLNLDFIVPSKWHACGGSSSGGTKRVQRFSFATRNDQRPAFKHAR